MIKFIEDTHEYIDTETDKRLISVTALIQSFEPKKNWDLIAERYAKKHKLNASDVKESWAKENRVALDRGIKFHKQREEDLLSCNTIEGLEIFRTTFDENGHKIFPSQKLTPGIYPELPVHLRSAGICGQADFVEIRDGLINIKDYKTNKEIKTNAYINWEGVEERLTGPLSSIPNCNYWKYALQLNTYAYIIRKNNPTLKIGTLELLHVQFDDQDEVVNIQPYVLPDLQGPVRSMIEYYKTRI